MPSPPQRCLYARPALDPKQQPQQQQRPADDQRDVEARARAKTTATAAAFAMRKQWEAKAASFQRGLEHVQHCHAGDACGSSLCHSTRRLMKTYATHPCPKKSSNNNNTSSADCRVCKLWDFLAASQQPPQLPRLQRALAQQGALSCGSTLLQTRRLLSRPSALSRRIATAQKEAQTLTRRY